MSSSIVARLWHWWLIAMCVIVALFGLSFILLPATMMATASNTYLGSPDAHQAFGADGTLYLRFALGTLGAITVAWMVAVGMVIGGPFRRGERWAWQMVTLSVVAWFVLDSTNSVLSGFPENALYNVAFLLGFAVPLGATYRDFSSNKRPTGSSGVVD